VTVRYINIIDNVKELPPPGFEPQTSGLQDKNNR